MRFTRPVVAIAMAASLATSATACSSGHKSSGADTPAPSGVAVQWWSNGKQSAGATIDPQHPTAGANALHPSRQIYCDMLQQTVKAGHSILPGVSGNSPELLASTEAFIADLQSVAPAQVSASWKVLGTIVLDLVKTGGKGMTASNAADISSAVTTVATDAKNRCGVNLGV